MKKLHSLKKNQIADIFVVILLLLVAGILFRNLNYFELPETDFFQFLDDAKNYRWFKLPDSIVSPPANPVLIAIFGSLLNHPQSELLIARSLNIFFFCISLYLLWKIAKSQIGILSLLLLALMLSNPISYYISLHPASETLFTLSLLSVLYLRMKGYTRLAYILSGLSFLIRYEAIALLFAMSITDLLTSSDKRKFLTYSFLGLSPVFAWLLVLNRQNPLGKLYGNAFAQEIWARRDTLPNYGIFDMQPFFHFIREKIQLNDLVAAITFGYIFIGALILFLKKNKEITIISIYLLSYLLIRFLFPAYSDADSYPVIWAVYFLGLWPVYLLHQEKKSYRNLTLPLAVLVLYFSGFVIKTNTWFITEYLGWSKYYRYETKLMANWFNQTKFDRPVLVITLEPWIVKYYTHNSQVIFHGMGPPGVSGCDSATCLIKTAEIETEGKDILFIRDNYTEEEPLEYWNTEHGIKIFKEFEQSKEAEYFTLIEVLRTNKNWVMIYKYNPPHTI